MHVSGGIARFTNRSLSFCTDWRRHLFPAKKISETVQHSRSVLPRLSYPLEPTMTFRRVMRSRAASIMLYGACMAAVFSCSRDPMAAPRGRAGASLPTTGKSPTALAVTSASPPFGDQGVTMDVHVFGSGFTPDAQATWLLHGAADPAHVRTNGTTFVSSTELVAKITIASDATLDFWDVQVALIGGKNGVGTELFEVTSAQILGPGTPGGNNPAVYGMSQNLQIMGWVSGGGGTPFVYDDVAGMVSLGSGQAWTIDPLGTIIGGRDANLIAIAWVHQSPSTWTAEQLPRLPFSVGGNVMGAARTSDGTLLVSGFDDSATLTKPPGPHFNRPVAWQRNGSVWSAPQRYTLPAGSVKGSARAINGLGQVAGGVDGGPTGAVWDNATTSTRLDGMPSAINGSGTLIVGEKTITATSSGTVTVPAYWWRNPSTGLWDGTGKQLPSLAGARCASGTVRGMNSAGILAGSSCNAAGKTQATVWHLDLSGPEPVVVAGPMGLPGLGTGPKNSNLDVSDAISVSEALPFTVAGMALESGITRLAVRWHVTIQ